jgi:hypothetical protein
MVSPVRLGSLPSDSRRARDRKFEDLGALPRSLIGLGVNALDGPQAKDCNQPEAEPESDERRPERCARRRLVDERTRGLKGVSIWPGTTWKR